MAAKTLKCSGYASDFLVTFADEKLAADFTGKLVMGHGDGPITREEIEACADPASVVHELRRKRDARRVDPKVIDALEALGVDTSKM